MITILNSRIQTKVDERITDLKAQIPEFETFLNHIQDSWLTKPEQPTENESDGERQDLDARNFEEFFDSDVGSDTGLSIMMDHMNWNPSELGFNPGLFYFVKSNKVIIKFILVTDIDQRKEMNGKLPFGNDFITKNWYDLNLFEKFGYLPDYKNDEKELLLDLSSFYFKKDLILSSLISEIYLTKLKLSRSISSILRLMHFHYLRKIKM